MQKNNLIGQGDLGHLELRTVGNYHGSFMARATWASSKFDEVWLPVARALQALWPLFLEAVLIVDRGWSSGQTEVCNFIWVPGHAFDWLTSGGFALCCNGSRIALQVIS